MDGSKLKDAKEVDELVAKLNIQKNLILEQQLNSGDVNDIFKASSYIKQTQKTKAGDVKAFLFDPYDTYYTAGGYKQQRKRVAFDILKKVSDTPIVGSVINTRIFQIQNFLRFNSDGKEEGYTIRKKRSIFDVKGKEPSTDEKKKIEFIVNFLENGGLKGKWDISDDLSDFTRKIMRDSLSLDQLAAECERNRRFELIGYNAIDASTIRILETIDPRFQDQAAEKYIKQFGYFPRYAQVFQGNIMRNPITNDDIVYYPWELMYAQRNKSTSLEKNGYGTSEVEVLLDIITWSLWGMQYNGNFFKQGSNPKGFINIKSDGVNMDIVNDFRQTWRQMIAGVNNSHKIPVFSGIDMEWVDLQGKNNEMEFQKWMEFLIIMLCSVFTIDPSELGYQFQGQSQMFGQDGQRERLEHSKKKGLKPLLLFLEKVITKWIVSEIDAEYEFVFTGLDTEDEAKSVELTGKKLASGMVSFESEFEKAMGRPYNAKKDTILNPVFQQAQAQKMFGGQGSNGAVDEMTGEQGGGAPNPFDMFEDEDPGQSVKGIMKSLNKGSNPILDQAMKYIKENIDIVE